MKSNGKCRVALVLTCTLIMGAAAEGHDAWPSNFQWISPRVLTNYSQVKFSWRFHLSPSCDSSCRYTVDIYFSEDKTLSGGDHRFYSGSISVSAGVTGFNESTQIAPGSSGWSSLPESGTYYVFLQIRPGWDAPSDTNPYNDKVMAASSVQVINDTPEKPLPSKAVAPSPRNGALEQPLTVVLSWSDGGGASSYDVYFGTDPSPDGGEFSANQAGTTYDLGDLAYSTTYYWRIDAKNAQGTTKGDVWNFTTMDPVPENTIIYVDAAAVGSNDGSSWTDAYNHLQDALAEASVTPGHVDIHVAQGVYAPDSSSAISPGVSNRAATFQLISNVSLRGGYAGFGEPDPSVRDVVAYETILTGDLSGNDMVVNDLQGPGNESPRSENSYHVVTCIGTDQTALLDGFTITAGQADSLVVSGTPPHRGRGGGMYNEESSPTLINCTFSANYAKDGGGMYNCRSYPILTNCTFVANRADGNGGGMCSEKSGPTLTNCTFSMNAGMSLGDGGGMYNGPGCSPILVNCILWYNTPNQVSPSLDCVVAYSDIQGGWPGEGNIDSEPLFVDLGHWAHLNDPNVVVEPNDPLAVWTHGDYHLKSLAGRWDPAAQAWMRDDVASPCIDAGDPRSNGAGEPEPNGRRINMGAYGGTAQASCSHLRVGVYRLWSAAYGRHFYTVDLPEKESVLKDLGGAWQDEGVAYYAFTSAYEPNVVPVYRFYSGSLNSHFYTISESERDYLIDDCHHTWTYEGIVFYVFQGDQARDASPVYRFWSPLHGTHFYTFSETEKDFVVATYPPSIWTYEGIAWYAFADKSTNYSAVDYFPLHVGDLWQYETSVTEEGGYPQVEYTYMHVAGEEEMFNDRPCYRVMSDIGSVGDEGCYFSVTAEGISLVGVSDPNSEEEERSLALRFIPPILLLKSSFCAGDTWSTTSEQTVEVDGVVESVLPVEYAYTVSASAPVTAPVGVFEDCIRVVEHVDTGEGAMAERQLWFARGVGVVKEEHHGPDGSWSNQLQYYSVDGATGGIEVE